MSFKNVKVPDLDKVYIEPVNVSITKSKSVNKMKIDYKFIEDEYHFHLTYTMSPIDKAGPIQGEEITSNIYLDKEFDPQYQWEDDHYQYTLILKDKKNKYTEDDILHIIELSSQTLHP